MLPPPPGPRQVRVETRNGTAVTGRVYSVKRGVVEVAGATVPAQRIVRWSFAQQVAA